MRNHDHITSKYLGSAHNTCNLSFRKSPLIPCFMHNFSEPNGKKVVCGDWKLNTTDTYEEALSIIEIINHPNFDGASLVNDIAVIKVIPDKI